MQFDITDVIIIIALFDVFETKIEIKIEMNEISPPPERQNLIGSNIAKNRGINI